MPSKPSDRSPDIDQLHDAALRYLARYASTEAGLRRMLNRKVDRWADSHAVDDASAADASRAAINKVVERLLNSGLLSDVSFAETRVRSLARGGRSSRSIQARLLAKGVAAEVARAVSPLDAETELAAAVVLMRRRRMGPYRSATRADETGRSKALARLARAGFSREVAERALDMPLDEAERRIQELRS